MGIDSDAVLIAGIGGTEVTSPFGDDLCLGWPMAMSFFFTTTTSRFEVGDLEVVTGVAGIKK